MTSWVHIDGVWLGRVEGGLLVLDGSVGYLVRLQPTPPRVQHVSLTAQDMGERMDQLVALWAPAMGEP